MSRDMKYMGPVIDRLLGEGIIDIKDVGVDYFVPEIRTVHAPRSARRDHPNRKPRSGGSGYAARRPEGGGKYTRTHPQARRAQRRARNAAARRARRANR